MNQWEALRETLSSRTISCPQLETATAFRLVDPNMVWQLSCRETTGNTSITVVLTFDSSIGQYEKRFTLGSKGLRHYQGTGCCVIQFIALSNDGEVDCTIQHPLPYQYPVTYEEVSQTTGTWSSVSSATNGYPRAGSNYLSLWVDGDFDFRATEVGGTVVATYTGLNPTTYLTSPIPVAQGMFYEIQSSGGVGSIRFKSVWWNKVGV